jgi:mannose-6-phosphate isomerase-like protein (cupin superfamily)
MPDCIRALPERAADADITPAARCDSCTSRGARDSRFTLQSRTMSGRADVKTVQKPWGHETIWAHTDRYVGKILHITAGQALSVQYHERKDETVYLLSGQLKYWVKLDGSEELKDMRLSAGDAFRITPGTIHYMEAVTDCDVLEASTPDLDDVVRLKDRYGREGTSAP